MINFQQASITNLLIQVLASNEEEEVCLKSNVLSSLNDDVESVIKHFLLPPFQKQQAVYTMDKNAAQNKINALIFEMLENEADFISQSNRLAAALIELAQGKLTKGELFTATFNGIDFEGETHNAVGIFRSESKETFLKIFPNNNGFNIAVEDGAISLNKLERAFLFIKSNVKDVLHILVAQSGTKAEQFLWIDHIFGLQSRNDNFSQTTAVMDLCRNFVSEKLEEKFEVERTDKIDLLNRSAKYFKEKDQFNLEEFSNEVIANPEGIALFKSYKENFEEEFNAHIADNFSLVPEAVKKQSKVFKSILKLDKNFHVYIHGNKDLIEKEFDADKGMNCYKLYYKEEQ